ncbi:replication initiation factor domain-containing protein [Paenilisteria newyorkensis]|uniref:replication initiation factor domain-containing protein n=1 Tax=Listeria newyorkensis TaxID=1497681 RepID=UPI000669C5DF|nr:replication initiation factor domain-containing protein [Listeria newyorkensis]KMT62879.1 replication initiation factor [Listeria newyorkensis]
MQAQGRDWFSFLEQCVQEGGKITRLDIAMDDRHGYFASKKSVPTGNRKGQQTKKGWKQLLQDTSALKLTSSPETAFYRKTEYCLKSQVSASMKLVQMADEFLGKESTLETKIEEAVLSDKHKAMLKVLTVRYMI